jgi:hypothetical protein
MASRSNEANPKTSRSLTSSAIHNRCRPDQQRRRRKAGGVPAREDSAFEIQRRRQTAVPGRGRGRAGLLTDATGKSKQKAIVISDDETDELADTTAQAEARRPPPKISDLLEYSSETEDSEDSLGSDNSDSDDLPDAEDYEMIDLRGKNVPPWAKDKAVAVDEVTPMRKQRRFEDYLDN